jgi:hypothetical protein
MIWTWIQATVINSQNRSPNKAHYLEGFSNAHSDLKGGKYSHCEQKS